MNSWHDSLVSHFPGQTREVVSDAHMVTVPSDDPVAWPLSKSVFVLFLSVRRK